MRLSADGDSISYRVTRTEKSPSASGFRVDRLDYALVHLEGNPGKRFGVLTLNRNAPVVGQPLVAIMFQATMQKLVDDDAGACRTSDVMPTSFAYRCSTRPGSAGAPILDAATTTVVGLEYLRSPSGGYAARIDAILRDSQALRALAEAGRGGSR
jgi:hypothetical protein